MKYLCLAYGDEAGWNSLTKLEQQEVIEADKNLRNRGDKIANVGDVVTVTAWDGLIHKKNTSYSFLKAPLVGFSLVEAETLDEVIQLVGKTPCARAKGAIEIRPISEDTDWLKLLDTPKK